MHAGDLRRTSRQVDGLKADTWNALVDSLKEKNLTQPGFGFADRQQAIRPRTYNREYFLFTCTSALTERSVFGITLNPLQEFANPPIVVAENINATSNASQFQLFTNVESYQPTNGFGRCKAIDFYEPTLLFVSDTNAPGVGMPCGPDYNTNNWGISAKSYGLICISPLDDNFNVWCIRTPDPIAVIGTIVNNDVPAFDSTTNELGEGLLQIQYRNPDANNELINANGPDDELLQLPIFNASTNVFKVNTLVKCIAVLGVGLVIVDTKNLIFGRADTNIPHFQTGVVNVYTGTPGSETWDGETTVAAFNQIGEVVANEWVFLTPTGASNTAAYYIVNSEYGGKILGKTVTDVVAGTGTSVEVQIYAGSPGAEIDIGESVSAFFDKRFYGAIPANTWVVCNFVAGDVDELGEWVIISAQKGDKFPAQVAVGSANPTEGYADVDSTINVILETSSLTDLMTVPALVFLAPVCDLEQVVVEWIGDTFIITSGELDGGFYAIAQQGQINNGSTGTVAMKPIANSQVLVSSLKVDTQEGNVEQGRTVYVCRNRAGFHIVSKSCS